MRKMKKAQPYGWAFTLRVKDGSPRNPQSFFGDPVSIESTRHKKSSGVTEALVPRVKDGSRTHDLLNHNQAL